MFSFFIELIIAKIPLALTYLKYISIPMDCQQPCFFFLQYLYTEHLLLFLVLPLHVAILPIACIVLKLLHN